jgi:hypothetical protein
MMFPIIIRIRGVTYTLYEEKNVYSVTGYDEDTIKPATIILRTYDDLPVTSIADEAFFLASDLVAVKVQDSILSIGNNAFYSCQELTSISLPDSLTSIGGRGLFFLSIIRNYNHS